MSTLFGYLHSFFTSICNKRIIFGRSPSPSYRGQNPLLKSQGTPGSKKCIFESGQLHVCTLLELDGE